MKHIHIVLPYQSVAMWRMSQPLIIELAKIYKVTSGETVNEDADLNYHIPWHTMVGLDTNGKHAIAYTHCNAGAEGSLIDACERADLITCMTFTGRQELIDLGVDPKKIWVIYCAADQHVFRKKMIGIVGYPQPNGRKRESLLLDLAWQYDMSPFQFVFVGSGWEEVVDQLMSCGVAATCHNADTDEKLRMFYQQIDLLLVTGYREGGPLPVLEAMASGKKVFSPRFGFASDLLDDDSIYSDVGELAQKLSDYVEPFTFSHKLARSYRWQDYCAEHALIFGRLLGETAELYPNLGTNRYLQLLEIIEEVKPKTIVEIGTWNGNRAIQMIQSAHRFNEDITYQGFDLFDEQTPQQVRTELSKHSWEIKLVRKRIETTLADVYLEPGNTLETLSKMLEADFYFVDGGHSEQTIKNDSEEVLSALCGKSVAVFDDYYHEGKPDGMGCNKFIDSLDRDTFEVTHLPNHTKAAEDDRIIGMVKVRRNAPVPLQLRETHTRSDAFYDR